MKKRSTSKINLMGFLALICLLALLIETDDTSLSGWGAGSSGSQCDNASPNVTIAPPSEERYLLGATDTIKCFTAYEDPHYSGASMRYCTNKSQSGKFLNNAFSSFKLDEGVALKVCDYSDGAGGCQTYHRSVSWVGYHFDDMISSIELGSYSPDSFKMIFASDPQLFWKRCDSITKGCANDGGTVEEVGTKTNRNHVKSMNALKKLHGYNLAGVVINGDLTAFGRSHEFDQYWQFYEVDLNMNLWPGLGNHDYANNVDDCWLEGKNNCAIRMVSYMEEKVDQLNPTGFDWSSSTNHAFPLMRERLQGSLAYSWDIGNIHFIQLQNFPLYQTTFDGWSWDGGDRNHYTIRSSIPWLIEDLESATAQNKKIILNFHVPGVHPEGDNHKRWHMFDGPFQQALEKYGQNVVAIMVGHHHQVIGQQKEIQVSHRTIPVFWNGSAIYQYYLLASFDGDSMKIEVVDSSKGKNYSLGPPEQYDISVPNTAP